ncbi:MAG: hypothetical protein ACLU4N_05415 [Butyricimonas faecihominis]
MKGCQTLDVQGEEMKVIFQVGRTELQPDRYGNQKVLDKSWQGRRRGVEIPVLGGRD